MSKPFRFLHLSDLYLGEPVTGIQDPTGDLREAMLAAPFVAMEKAFSIAIRERVEFILLTGNILDLHQPSPKSISFLHRQFERLLSSGIEVYWCSGPLDPAHLWPTALDLPENVALFGSSTVEITEIQNEHGAICTLLTCGPQPVIEPDEFAIEVREGFVIGAVHGQIDLEILEEIPCDYWALGGRRHRRVAATDSKFAIYPGSPQSRTIDHLGPCGINLVSVDDRGGAHCREIACDTIRFAEQQLTLKNIRPDSIRETLYEAHMEAADIWDEGWCVINWTIVLEDASSSKFLSEAEVLSLVEELRSEFGTPSTKTWCNQIQLGNPAFTFPQSMLEEDSILGDFLRSLPDWEANPDRVIDLLSKLDLPPEWSSQAVTEPLKKFDRKDLLCRVKKMGLELLSGTADA
ncbi:MAG: hypothetical protein VXY07_11445 [Planctomycetota bacterium]|jgi:DNA repair exonuclease SbcCD nuclease subunit|nr:hypothetical protein [Planctomycetota bacterium]MEC7717851.1 hypothetical protein [Planctomycetota bacterium]MEC8303548.1 hypothetical protein [Planctomycetota bacterium]MEC8509793.1 hypothetical protein [Planctomycetota bacterium]MEC8590134.1 hypothetical protein [Planctomycetota bacterium]